ncbi:cache domain-containing protein [Caldimonas thermodepolymerans]|uniref:histidine kinase n=2 Tax=Caldimonas thermodepolymerans TaxID=215580 RepID=A0AA46DG34_9BURK|nr:cache domain-containing protein [Caldimonas thermodepolymerans]RDI02690.1 HAMP domain-containing protein [Caldimonas thermodepolymerans]TCP08780.1 HAMP domain-containing protein [Caldimonas thermodepolymerans]UZG47101.1 cache domain-containing protein [Caldimonas thermodepolymerans]
MKFERLSIRAKLLWMVLLPLVVVLPLLGVILLGWSNTAIDRLLVTKVRSDLAVARGYFDRVLDEVSTGTDIAAQSHPLHLALAQGRPEAMQDLLERFRQRAGLDFLNVYDASGRLVAASWGLPEQPRLALDRVPLSDARPAASVELLQPEEVAGIAPPLVGRLGIPLVPTEGAAPTDRQVEHRALVVLATAPVLDADGRLLAQVRGGVLLNRNLAFIDHINEIVYPEGSLPFGSQGTATLFLEDVRITTNVRLFGNERAIGTRVSQAVRDAVLGRGSTWLDRAFVVNDWYVSGYEPLQDRQGRRVGMLYVGFLERPFTLVKYAVLAGIGIVFFGVMIGAAWVSLRLARGIFQPLEQMARTMREVEGGNAQARVGEVASQDEIGQLAGHLDHLLVAVDEKTRALQRWGEELDRKVAERTRDLERAQQQLVRSEKLAAIGQLTASVAHEVNNPIAVIQGNLDLVRELLGPDAKRVAAELKLMDEQIERMRLIVTQLLQFARPTEYAGYVESVDVHQALEASLVLVGHMLSKTRIEVERDFRATRTVGINRQELQQVLINLIVNAVQAMPGGGVLRLATRDWEDLGVVVQVADTGPGLSEELLAELFQPFVTRKKDGTGLGLWISRSIVERYGGDLRGENRPEGGAVFSLRVRGEPVEAAG